MGGGADEADSIGCAEPEREEALRGAELERRRSAAELLAILLAPPCRQREERVRALLARNELATLARVARPRAG